MFLGSLFDLVFDIAAFGPNARACLVAERAATACRKAQTLVLSGRVVHMSAVLFKERNRT